MWTALKKAAIESVVISSLNRRSVCVRSIPCGSINTGRKHSARVPNRNFIDIQESGFLSSCSLKSSKRKISFSRRSTSCTMSSAAGNSAITYLKQDEAVKVDEELMGPLGFSVDQLMELAGLSCACALAQAYPTQTHQHVLIIAGPGNNGGDGLVMARHLHHFGYKPQILYPKPTDRALYNGLVTQCKSLQIPFLTVDDTLAQPLSSQFSVVVDAMFGFSFSGAPRPPFKAILDALKPDASPPPIVSVDIPSGWQVEAGDVDGDGIRPNMLVSLTAPKECARNFKGEYHFLGGRFVPPEIAEKYKLKLPAYPGTSMCVQIPAAL